MLPASIRPLNNHVLIKPNRDERIIKIKGKYGKDLTLELDTSYEEMKHTVIVGDVVSVPKEILYDRDSPSSVQWETTMELQEGDTVTYYFIAARDAITKNKYFIEDGQLYIYVRYDEIFAAKRGDEVIIPNGYVIVEPEMEKLATITDIELREKKSQNVGIVRYIGSPNKQYKYEPDRGGDDPRLQKGDKVLLNKVCDIPLEYPLHKEFDKEKEYYRVERKNVLAVLN